MSVPALPGIFGFALQSAKGAAPTTFYKHFASDINYGPVQDLRAFPLEVGGNMVPTGPYKGGVFMGGGATVMPRMEGDLGFLLKALMGSVSSTSLQADLVTEHAAFASDATAAAVTTGWTQPASPRQLAIYSSASLVGTCVFTIIGKDDNDVTITEAGLTCTTTTLIAAPLITANKYKTITSLQITGASTGSTPTITVAVYKKNVHDFKFAADVSSLPWVYVRKYIPGDTALYEQGLDNKVTSMRFALPQNGIISTRMDFLGRVPDWSTPSPVNWKGAFEDYTSVPITCDINGSIKLPNSYYSSAEVPITSLVCTMTNNLTSPTQEMIIGSPYPDDFVPLSRAMSFQATVKWSDPQLYLDIMTGNTTGTGWSSNPFVSNLDATITAPGTIPGDTSQYSLEIKAGRIMWGVAGPPTLVGGDIITLPLIGTALLPAAGTEYAEFIVTNENVSYA